MGLKVRKNWDRSSGGLLVSWVTLPFFLPGEASAVLAKAKAKAEAIRILAGALTQHVRG